MDIALNAGGDIPREPYHATGIKLVRQRIENRLLTHRGEWILDSRQGIPYVEWFQTRPIPLDAISDAIRFEIETTPGVTSIVNFDARATGRTVLIDATVVTLDGTMTIQTETDPSQSRITRVRIA